MQAQFEALSKKMATARSGPNVADNAAAYNNQLRAINELRNGTRDLAGNFVPGFNAMMQASGAFEVQTVKTVSSTERMTKAIMDQKVGAGAALSNLGKFRNTIRDVAVEQEKLRKASAMQWTNNSTGKTTTDMYIPKNLSYDMVSAQTKAGTMLRTLQAMGTATQNWGKNTQWAGRQITAGFTMPLALAAAGLASLANKADTQLTRIAKVYDAQSSSIEDSYTRQIAMEKELSAVKAASMDQATKLAATYGANVAQTLEMEADLAAVGKTGNELMDATAQVTRIATLGELDLNTAMGMTVSLMSTYKMNAKELGDAFNYMNSLENATALSTKDFAEAIPTAASSMASLGVDFKQFGIMMTAFKEGGINASQGANALKSATGRLMSVGTNKAALTAFHDMKIDIESIANQSGGNLFKFLTSLSTKFKDVGASALDQQKGIKALFGTYQYNRLNVVLQNLGDALSGVGDKSSQTARAIAIANQSTDQWAATADAEIKQFQQSASGRLKIAMATLKADLTQMGAPILSSLSGIVGGLTTIVKALMNIPGPVKSVFKVFAIAMAVTGPVLMFIGLLGNWYGAIMKVIGGVGALLTRFTMWDKEAAAQNALEKTAIQTKDKSAAATANLALTMQKVVTVMQEQIALQQELNAAQLAGAKAAEQQAAAQSTAAAAQTKAATSAAQAAQATANAQNAIVTMQRVADQNAARANTNPNATVGGVPGAAQTAAMRATQWAASRNPTDSNYNYMGPFGNFGTTGRNAGLFAARASGSAAYVAREETQRGARFAAALARAPEMDAAGRAIGNAAARRVFEVTSSGSTRQMGALQAALYRNVPAGTSPINAPYQQNTMFGPWRPVDTDSRYLSNQQRWANAPIPLRQGETHTPYGPMPMLGPASPASLPAGASRVMNYNPNVMQGPVPFGPQAPNSKYVSGMKFAEADAKRIADAEKRMAEIRNSSEKSSVSWGKVAGSMGALAIGSMMIKNMATSSNSIGDNILQGALAFSMLAPVLGAALNKLKAMRAAQAEMAALSAAQGGAAAGSSVIARGWGAVWTGIKKAGGAIKTLFTTPLGIAAVAVTAIAIAWVGINNYMSRASRRQAEINQSTKQWQSILGYAGKSMMEIGQNYDSATDADRFSALTEGANQLADANEGLADALGEAANKGDGYKTLYNMAVNEALKVKVDGGSAQQAKMAFDTALKASGVGNQTITDLDVKFQHVNLEDPQGIADAINDQISQALDHSAGDGFHLSGGWDRQLFNAIFLGPMSEGDLGDDATAMFESLGSEVATAIKNGMASGDPSQIKDSMASLTKGLDQTFQESFSGLRGDHADLFKKAGIDSMTKLRDAMVAAAKAQKNGTATAIQKELLGSGIVDSKAYKEYYQAWKTMMGQIANANGLKEGTKGYENFMSAIDTVGQLQGYFTDGMTTSTRVTKEAGNAANQTAADFLSLADAMNTSNFVATGQQYAKEMQDAYGGTIQTYLGQAQQAFEKHHQAQVDSLQAAGEASQAAYDKQLKAVKKHYDNLGKTYDKNIKAKKDAADAEIKTVNAQIEALKDEDNARQELFDNEKTRLQRMAQLANNNIDFNSALSSGNLDEAAKLYNSNGATVQGWAYDDQQKAMDKASEAKQKALQDKIDIIEADRDAYVDAQQAKKDALSDLEQAEEDAINKSKDADKKRTDAAIKAANDRYDADKQSLQLQLDAITAFVPQSVDQVHSQIDQINGAYGDFGMTLKQYGSEWSGIIGNDLKYNIAKAAESLQSDIGWSQIGDYIQAQIDSGAAFTLEQATEFLKTGKWPEDIGGDTNDVKKKQAWRASHPDKITYAPGKGIYLNGKLNANHTGTPSGVDMRQLGQKERQGYPHGSAPFSTEYLTLLEHGEFVVNKQASSKYRTLLEAINGGAALSDTGRMMTSRHSGGFIGDSMMTATMMARAGVMAQAAKNAVTAAFLGSLGTNSSGLGEGTYVGGMTNDIKSTLDFARSQQGKPYIWGGAGAAGQDCSGFISVLYNYLSGHSPYGASFPWGRDWTTSSFAGGKEFGPWKRDSRGNGSHRFRIGVDPGSHMAGTLGGLHVESGSGHGPRVGGNALGADDRSFPYQYYLPAADLPQLYKGGTIQYDNTLANLHKGETVLTAPLTDALTNNVANGFGSEYNVEVHVNGPVSNTVDFEKAVYNALVKLDSKTGRNRTIN